jgi:hypothetical protein
VWRICFGVFAIITTACLMLCCLSAGRSPWYVALFGWHPLTVVETSGMAHQDILGIALLAIAWLAWTKSTADHPTPAVSASSCSNAAPLAIAGVFLAFAAGVKPIAGIVAIFWFITRPRIAWIVPFIVSGLLLGTLLLYQDGYVGFLKTLRTYTNEWEANGSIFQLIRTQMKPIWTPGFELFIEPWEFGRMLAAVGSTAVVIGCIRRRARWVSAYYAVCLAGLLLGPIVYPWYLLWPLAAVPLLPRGGLTLLVFAGTCSISYALWHQSIWRLPAWMTLLEYVPVYLALFAEEGLCRSKQAAASIPAPIAL